MAACKTRTIVVAAALMLGCCAAADAGMPVPLPLDYDTIELMTQPTRRQVVSLVVAGVLVLAFAATVKVAWNALAKDFPRMPRLGYVRALGVTLLWGLLMFLVLVLISGTRQALTPNAWVRDGWVYQLTDEATQSVDDYRARRRMQMEELKTALFDYADTHDGSFPASLAVLDLPPETRTVPETAGLDYVYQPAAEVLLTEPAIDDLRWSLTRDGRIEPL